MKVITTLALAASMLAAAPQAFAQNSAATLAAAPHTVRTYRLTYATSQAEQNEILTAIRNIVSPNSKIFLLPSSNEIAVNANSEDHAIVADLLPKLDLPHKQCRLTYTLIDSDGGKRIGLQHYSMVVMAGQRVQMKEGSRVPLVTGEKGAQRQYLDVGLLFDSTLQEHGSGFQLRSRVEQSSIAAEKSGVGPEDPVIRQTSLEGSTVLPEGKAVSLGSLDVLGSTRRLDVEVTVEAVK